MLFPDLRLMTFGSVAVGSEQRLQARARLTANFVEMYGSNEIGVVVVATPDDQDRYPDAVGRVVSDIETQIVDANETVLPHGEIGEVRFRDDRFPQAYLSNPEASAKAFRNG
jgi:acyl-CoA synthetase (AMP-forming)/AMP-acid ligase II